MARVLLTREILDGGRLPPVCMQCGAPADVIRIERMAFRSSVFLYWAFLFGVWSLLLFEAVGPRVTVSAPMCLDHQGHWLKRRIMRIALIIAGIWLFFAAVTLRSWFGMDPSMNHLGTVFSYCYVGLMPCFAIFVGVLEAWMIGPGDMGPRGVTMRNVHPAFRDAVDHAN